jgi:hypothetical protein
MNQKEFAKQVTTMQTDIFHLDRMLPLATVYEKEPQKSIFMDNSKYKRLREGYFGLFVAAALNHWENSEHFMTFPTAPENDINILSIKDLTTPKPLFNKMVCDVKEFTDHEKSFVDFIEQKIGPKLNTYSVIIGSHRDITDFKPLYDMVIAKKGLTTYIVTAADPIDSDFSLGMVTMFSPEITPMQLKVSLKESLKIDDSPALIFQDKLRDKLA